MTRESARKPDADLTPRTPEERELVRNLLRGVRAFERAGIFVRHEWCRVRRSPRAGLVTMTMEIDSERYAEQEK